MVSSIALVDDVMVGSVFCNVMLAQRTNRRMRTMKRRRRRRRKKQTRENTTKEYAALFTICIMRA